MAYPTRPEQQKIDPMQPGSKSFDLVPPLLTSRIYKTVSDELNYLLINKNIFRFLYFFSFNSSRKLISYCYFSRNIGAREQNFDVFTNLFWSENQHFQVDFLLL